MVSGGDSKIGSCTQVLRSNGEIFAVAHPHKKTGYKSSNSETNVRMLGSKTSYKQFYEDEVALPTVTKNPKGMSYRWAPCRPRRPRRPAPIPLLSPSPAPSHSPAARRPHRAPRLAAAAHAPSPRRSHVSTASLARS